MDSNPNIPSKCPHSNLSKKVGIFGGNSNKKQVEPKEETVDTTMLTTTSSTTREKKCPFDTEKAIGLEMNSNMPKGKCPYQPKDPAKQDKEDHTIKIEEVKAEIIDKESHSKPNDDDLSDDDAPTGGCPVMNKRTKKDPVNKHWEPHHEIQRFGPYDFMFILKGLLEHEDFIEKTKKVRLFPRHLKYTLFVQHNEKLKKVHEVEFPKVFFLFDDIKEKGNRLFRRKKYREAIDHYTYAYGLLKWIEFKDTKRGDDFLKKPSLEPILDDDILEKHVFLDDVKVEEDSFKACVVYLLSNLSYAYMELRHYSEAVDALDECITIAEDKLPDLFFKRSQARTYNKNSSKEELELAMQDIEKAIVLKDEEPMYKEHKDILIKITEGRLKAEIEKTEKVLERAKKSFKKIKDKNIQIDEVIYTKKDKDALTQYKILKEMKNKYALAIKFFTESKNEEQLEISYREIESFMETFETFKFYLRFSADEIPIQVLDGLSEEEKNMLNDETHIKLIDEFKYKLCEDIFSDGNFNFELFQYALEKVFAEQRKVEEEEERELEESRPKVSWLESIRKSSFIKYLSGGIMLLSIGSIGVHYYLYSSSSLGPFFK